MTYEQDEGINPYVGKPIEGHNPFSFCRHTWLQGYVCLSCGMDFTPWTATPDTLIDELRGVREDVAECSRRAPHIISTQQIGALLDRLEMVVRDIDAIIEERTR